VKVEQYSSPPRRPNRASSPPLRTIKPERDGSPPRKKANDDTTKHKMSGGGTAGLHTGTAIREQALAKIEREKERLAKMDPKLLGKGEATVFRDKRGRRLTGLETFMQQQDGKYTSTEEDGMEWGKGKVQQQQKIDKQQAIEEEKNKPFARTINDDDLNDMWKGTDRWGDPMAGHVKKMKTTTTVAKPTYKGPPAPPNRFNIPPGYRWDGEDRSNGFEKLYFEQQAKRAALKDEAYMWSVEDM